MQNAIITMVTLDRSPIIIGAELRSGHVTLAGNVSGKMEDTGGGGGEGLILKLVHGEGPSRITLDSNRFGNILFNNYAIFLSFNNNDNNNFLPLSSPHVILSFIDRLLVVVWTVVVLFFIMVDWRKTLTSLI